MIFQDPLTSLNPVFTIGNQIIESLKVHQKLSKEEARKKAEDILELLEDMGSVPAGIRQMVMEQRELETLNLWLKLAAKAKSIEEFEKQIFKENICKKQ